MTNVNCSYTHVNGTYIDQTCTSGAPYCCQATDAKYCSTTECPGGEESSSFELTTIVFWGILGGFLVTGFTIMVVIYVFCYSRNPGNCLSRNPLDDLLEIPGQKQDAVNKESNRASRNTQHSSLNQSGNDSPTPNGRTISTGHRPRNVQFKIVQETRTISVTPQSSSPEEQYAASLDHVKLVANGRRKRFAHLRPTESSSSPSNSSRNFHHVTSIATME